MPATRARHVDDRRAWPAGDLRVTVVSVPSSVAVITSVAGALGSGDVMAERATHRILLFDPSGRASASG